MHTYPLVTIVIELVAEAGGEAGAADGGLHGLSVEAGGGTCRRDNILLDHNRAKVISTAAQRKLGNLFAYGEPRCLYILDIVEYDATHGDDAQILSGREAW